MDYKLIIDISRLENQREYLDDLIANIVEAFEGYDTMFYASCFDMAANRIEIIANYDFLNSIKHLVANTCHYSYKHPDKCLENRCDEKPRRVGIFLRR